MHINGVRVFSATKFKEREFLGETITDWLALNPHAVILDRIVTQSSDKAFHCVAITLFYYLPPQHTIRETRKAA